MAVQTFTLIPNGSHSGVINSDAQFPNGISVPANVLSARFYVVSTTFTDPSTHLRLDISESKDGGNTFNPSAYFDAPGGTGGSGKNPGPPECTYLPNIPCNARAVMTITGTVTFALKVDITT